jgi:GxxExxY protein
MDDKEFKARVYEVMGHVFDIHAQLGRLFHEKIYQRELWHRLPDAQREVPVEVRFEDFCKTYFLDLLVGGGALFELKAAEALTKEHERQLMHYLFLTDLPHGKLVNLRPERVEHRFVNNVMSPLARSSFEVDDQGWQEIETQQLKERLIAVLRDWGTGLGIAL